MMNVIKLLFARLDNKLQGMEDRIVGRVLEGLIDQTENLEDKIDIELEMLRSELSTCEFGKDSEDEKVAWCPLSDDDYPDDPTPEEVYAGSLHYVLMMMDGRNYTHTEALKMWKAGSSIEDVDGPWVYVIRDGGNTIDMQWGAGRKCVSYFERGKISDIAKHIAENWNGCAEMSTEKGIRFHNSHPEEDESDVQDYKDVWE